MTAVADRCPHLIPSCQPMHGDVYRVQTADCSVCRPECELVHPTCRATATVALHDPTTGQTRRYCRPHADFRLNAQTPTGRTRGPLQEVAL